MPSKKPRYFIVLGKFYYTDNIKRNFDNSQAHCNQLTVNFLNREIKLQMRRLQRPMKITIVVALVAGQSGHGLELKTKVVKAFMNI